MRPVFFSQISSLCLFKPLSKYTKEQDTEMKTEQPFQNRKDLTQVKHGYKARIPQFF